MLPYIDVEGLQEIPLTLLGRFPDKMTKEIVDKIGANDTLFQVHARDLKTFTWIS
jgi:hypothetical protein